MGLSLRRAIRRLRALPQDVATHEQRLVALEDLVTARLDGLEQEVAAQAYAAADLAVACVRRELDAVAVAAREHAEAASGAALSAALSAAREHAEAAATQAGAFAMSASREHAEAAVAASTTVSTAEALAAVERVRRELVAEIGRVRRAARSEPRAAPVEPIAGRGGRLHDDAGVPDGFYVDLEDRFRGEPDEIAERQEAYVELVAPLTDDQHPVLDLGSGRGEWLEVLKRRGVPATGAEINEAALVDSRARGVTVEQVDLMTALRAAADGSRGAITLFQVAEHLPFGVLVEMFEEAARVLRPGGVLVVETPNALNLRVAASTFWLDPTHVRPLHPEMLRFLATRAGFVRTADRFSSQIGAVPSFDDERLSDEVRSWLAVTAERIDGPGDYALIAWTSDVA